MMVYFLCSETQIFRVFILILSFFLSNISSTFPVTVIVPLLSYLTLTSYLAIVVVGVYLPSQVSAMATISPVQAEYRDPKRSATSFENCFRPECQALLSDRLARRHCAVIIVDGHARRRPESPP